MLTFVDRCQTNQFYKQILKYEMQMVLHAIQQANKKILSNNSNQGISYRFSATNNNATKQIAPSYQALKLFWILKYKIVDFLA